MTRILLLLALLLILALFCERHRTVLDTDPVPNGSIYLSLNKTLLEPQDSLIVTLHNQSDRAVYLEGCNPIYLGTKVDTGWQITPLRICVWEGFAVKIAPGETYQERDAAKYFPGARKFVAPLYFSCQDNEPISQAHCVQKDTIESVEFRVEANH